MLLLGRGYDRVMKRGDSFDLKVIANLINSLNFKKVVLFDVHSDVATALINNSINIQSSWLLHHYKQPNSVLICPDAGAAKKINTYLKEYGDIFTSAVYCNKKRDADGKIALDVLEPEKCEGRECVIIDDICVGW